LPFKVAQIQSPDPILQSEMSEKKLDPNDQKTLADFINQPAKVVGVKRIIAIASAKGGVGKSTISCNLAIALSQMGFNTALVDADIYGPSIPHLMNLAGKPDSKEGLILPMISHGVKCISIGLMVDEKQAGVWRGPMVTKILHQLIRSVNWKSDNQEVDFMIIDMPPGTGDVYLSTAQSFPLDGVIIVSTPQALAVIDVVKSIDCFRKLNVPILGLIQNMAFFEDEKGQKNYLFGQDGAKKLAEKEGINFLGEIALIKEIADSSENKLPITISDKKIAKIFTEIVQKI
jgi:ATP-binding protein involved in chromosome partitioning